MKRTRTKAFAGFFIFVATLTAALESPARAPNIVFIMADDHGRQATSCYGGTFIQTPNIDRLAHEGVRFTHAMAGNSNCSPSRAMLLIGKYNHLGSLSASSTSHRLCWTSPARRYPPISRAVP